MNAISSDAQTTSIGIQSSMDTRDPRSSGLIRASTATSNAVSMRGNGERIDHTGVGDGVSGQGGIASLSRPTRNALRVRVGRESEAIPPLRVRVVRVGRASEAIPPSAAFDGY